ncbi:hypothetical protein A9R05_15635 [Burkholderia sp. KK1]|nr:hypothetical protein A9R05_15635 [Burkholderia sp. KK1]
MKVFFAFAVLVACASVLADTTTSIAEQQARIAALRKDVASLVAPLQTIHSDVRVFASLEPIVAAVADLNGRPANERTLTLQSTAPNGHIIDNNNLCNSFAELQGPGDLHAQGELTGLRAATQDDGSILFSGHAATSGHIQLHVQFFGPRIYPPWPLPRGGGTCPYGGGNGTSVGAGFNKDLDLHIRVSFALSPDGQSLTYQAVLIDPTKVDVTVSIGLGALGNLGYPISFDIPQSPYTGQFPLLITKGGAFTIPGETGPRKYALVLKPGSFAATKAGVAVEWTSVVDFKQPQTTN